MRFKCQEGGAAKTRRVVLSVLSSISSCLLISSNTLKFCFLRSLESLLNLNQFNLPEIYTLARMDSPTFPI